LTLRERADALARTCNPLLSKGFSTDGNIDLRADAGLGADYQASTISYKLFQPEAFSAPSFGATINDDIQALLQIYREYKDKGRAVTTIIQPHSYSEICSNFHKNCSSTDCGLSFSIETVCNFIASLAAKPFLVLTGLSGSGKTKLAQAFVRWLTPDSSLVGDSGRVGSNPQYALIPVGADWTGNENILGYPDGLDSSRYVSKPALEVILHAHNHPELPHFLILDEMNLSHVERYFADMLSAIESGEPIPLYEGADRSKDGTTKIPQRVSVPRNLFIIGTVNVDETTYMFSPKVLDRANVIEFRMDSRELGSFLKNPAKPDLGKLDGAGAAFARTFVHKAKSSFTIPTEIAPRFEEEMLLLFKVLQSSGAEFGYRVAQEASQFVHCYKELGAFSPGDTKWFDDALDAVIVQKLLPKLHGSRGKLEGLLWALATFCGGERTGTTEAFLTECLAAAKCEDEVKFSPEAVNQKLRAANPERKARYASSFDKILRMYRKLVRDQFVTFAEA
jgi:5-methylcytosine-specific restriction protein B